MSAYSHIHLGQLEQLSRGNRDFIVRMLQTCLKSIPEQIDVLQLSLKTDNREALQMAAHRLRPAFHYLGRADISAQLEQLEDKAIQADRDHLHETITTLTVQADQIVADARRALLGFV